MTRWQKRAQAIDWVVGEHLLKYGDLYGEWAARIWAAKCHALEHGLWSEDQTIALVRDEMEREIDAQVARRVLQEIHAQATLVSKEAWSVGKRETK